MKLRKFEPKRARIEIVPMIDTIFFLLVYFLMATLTMTRMPSSKVDLPVSKTAMERPDTEVVVTVTRTGKLFLDRRNIAEQDLTPALASMLRQSPNLAVVINCDKNQPVAGFGRVFDLVKQANPATVMVATTPDDDWSRAQ